MQDRQKVKNMLTITIMSSSWADYKSLMGCIWPQGCSLPMPGLEHGVAFSFRFKFHCYTNLNLTKLSYIYICRYNRYPCRGIAMFFIGTDTHYWYWCNTRDTGIGAIPDDT